MECNLSDVEKGEIIKLVDAELARRRTELDSADPFEFAKDLMGFVQNTNGTQYLLLFSSPSGEHDDQQKANQRWYYSVVPDMVRKASGWVEVQPSRDKVILAQIQERVDFIFWKLKSLDLLEGEDMLAELGYTANQQFGDFMETLKGINANVK